MGVFNKDHYPTPESAFFKLTEGLPIHEKVILEPSVGAGAIVDYLMVHAPAEVLGCEIDPALRIIASEKCRIIEYDFMDVKAENVSHIDYILMNPPFSADEQHIIHAWEIAPPGCEIRALCNYETIRNTFSRDRKKLYDVIKEHGDYKSIGRAFDGNDAERNTTTEIALIKLTKPGKESEFEFEGFFMTDEEEEAQAEALRPYNFVRDLVGRYIKAIEIFDEQLETANKLNEVTRTFFSANVGCAVVLDEKQGVMERETYIKELQKSAWKFVIDKFNLERYVTKNVRSDINKFVEQNKTYPFTMKNVYRMIEILICTVGSRMDIAIETVFDNLTKSTFENRYNVEGYKTNSNYLVNEKFIMNGLFGFNYHSEMNFDKDRGTPMEFIDMLKALCYIEGVNYDMQPTLSEFLTKRWYATHPDGTIVMEQNSYNNKRYDIVGISPRHEKNINQIVLDFKEKCRDNGWICKEKPLWGKWFDFGFFEIKGYKKGTAHVKFKDRDVWARFNINVARIKGFPLPDSHDFGSKKRNEKARKAHNKTK